MSHVALVDVNINDLQSLASACESLGLEFVENQKTYKWYGRHVGDYPLPKGFTVKDLGQCEHAIRVKGNSRAYEIGVVRRRDGVDGWTLIYDFYGGGFGLEDIVGDKSKHLTQSYSRAKTIKSAVAQGFRVTERKVGNKIQLLLSK